MDWGALFFLLALVALTGLYVALPMLRGEGTLVTAEEQEQSALLARRDQVLDTLTELDFDFNTGKVDEDHYQMRRQALMQEAAAILKRLDALKLLTSHDPLESLLKQRKAQRGALAHGDPDDAVEALLAARRRARSGQKAAGFCPQCGAPVLESDRFCPRCGAALKA